MRQNNPFVLPANPQSNPQPEGLIVTRRQLLKIALSAPLFAYVGTSHAAETVKAEREEPWLSLAAVQNHLLPNSAAGLGAEQIQALSYLQLKMQRPLADSEDLKFLQQGVGWLNDFAQSQFQRPFVDLPSADKETLLQQIGKSQAGQNWLGMLLNNLIEALLTDPIYGGNPNGIGWQSVGQTPGYPLPGEQQRYYELGYQQRQRNDQQRGAMRLTKA